MNIFNPDMDGKTHINAYSKSKCELGRLLSNFAHTPFKCENGQFESIEGLWYWLSCPEDKREILRTLYGFRAKEVGRQLRGSDWNNSETFKNAIKDGIRCKLRQNKTLIHMLYDSDLPIVHYYSYGNPPKINIPQDGKWIWQYYEELRAKLHEAWR